MSRDSRTLEIEQWLKNHPRPRVPAAEPDDKPEVHEQFDRVQIGQVWGTYRRQKHPGAE